VHKYGRFFIAFPWPNNNDDCLYNFAQYVAYYDGEFENICPLITSLVGGHLLFI